MNTKSFIFYITIGISIVALWEFAAENNAVRVLISKPTLILSYFIDNSSSLGAATLMTLMEALCGLLIATTFSFGVMILCLYFPVLMKQILPVMVVSQVIPLITLAPLFIILFGAGIISKILMAALLCFFPIFVNFANGVRLISNNINELMYVFNTNTSQRIRHVFFPLSLPNIMSGLKVASTLAVIGAIVAEFSGAETGLGLNLYISALRLEPELMMCSLLLSTLLGGLIFGTVHLLEVKLGFWYLNK